MNFLRILIPSWRFFDQPGDTFDLLCRVRLRSDQSFGPWKACLDKNLQPPRHLGHLFLNPNGNLYLAQRGIVDRLVQEIDQSNEMPAELPRSVSYQLVKSIAHRQALESLETPLSFQFAVQADAEALTDEERFVLISAEYVL